MERTGTNFHFVKGELTEIEAYKNDSCEGCKYECGGQKDHMEGCLMEWTDAVSRYWTEAQKYITRGIVFGTYDRLRIKLDRIEDFLSHFDIQTILDDFHPDQDMLNTVVLPGETVYYLNDIYITFPK